MDISVDRIKQAAADIDPVFRDTPQYVDPDLRAALGRDVLIKNETLNPLRSFKGRGADFRLAELAATGVNGTVVCASSGNFGQGVGYAGRARGMPVEVFVPEGVNPGKLARMRALGATLIHVQGGADELNEAARERGRQPGAVLVEDGRDVAVAEGAGTIAVELFATETPDLLVIPVGDGSLITGVARWARHVVPDVRVIGVCSTAAPAMAESFRAGKPVVRPSTTIADGISIGVPIPESMSRVRALVDDIVLVTDDDLRAAMRLVAGTLGQFVEPAGVAGIAALTRHDLPGRRPATLLTGANVHPDLLRDTARAVAG
ncbi:threonine dehydratase [Amycolatopsis arida]|uniref:Threonine dehydratase n=1 Tax=Amycolatopsis arida TaxID=587909 RepID=A0A1I6A737_9PSEU|nr:pyridoxal-phosphate dependent enzyme [Amycolatopsis arida]TDX88556.1 threonine dehydratase [Amycolatopsis arida]SFQ64541.1 threonine dehydratase [Amycolatopsis arida]